MNTEGVPLPLEAAPCPRPAGRALCGQRGGGSSPSTEVSLTKGDSTLWACPTVVDDGAPTDSVGAATGVSNLLPDGVYITPPGRSYTKDEDYGWMYGNAPGPPRPGGRSSSECFHAVRRAFRDRPAPSAGPPPAAAQTPDGARTGPRTAPAAVRPRTAADGSSDGPRTEAWPRRGRGGTRIPAASSSAPGAAAGRAAARGAAPCCTAPALTCGPGSPYTENNLLFPGSLTAVGARGASERGCRGGGAACARARGRAARLLARRGAATARRGSAYLHARPRGRRRRVMK
jgi:hypothetical protein